MINRDHIKRWMDITSRDHIKRLPLYFINYYIKGLFEDKVCLNYEVLEKRFGDFKLILSQLFDLSYHIIIYPPPLFLESSNLTIIKE